MSMGVFITGFCVLFSRIAVDFVCGGGGGGGGLGFGLGRAIAMRFATAAVVDASGVTSSFLVMNWGLDATAESPLADACVCGRIFR